MDVNNERSCKRGVEATVFNGASNEGGPSAPLGRTNKEPCQHSGYFPCTARGPGPRRSRRTAAPMPPRAESFVAPAGLDEQDIFVGLLGRRRALREAVHAHRDADAGCHAPIIS